MSAQEPRLCLLSSSTQYLRIQPQNPSRYVEPLALLHSPAEAPEAWTRSHGRPSCRNPTTSSGSSSFGRPGGLLAQELSVSHSRSLNTRPFISMSIYRSIDRSTYKSLSIYLFIYLSLSVYLSVCLSYPILSYPILSYPIASPPTPSNPSLA